METVRPFADAWMPLFGVHMMEVSAFLLLVWAADRLLRMDTRLRYGLSLMALVKVFVPPLFLIGLRRSVCWHNLRVRRWRCLWVLGALFLFVGQAEGVSSQVPDSLLQVGIRLYAEGKYREVIRTFEGVTFDSLSAQAAYCVGASCTAESDFQNAIRYLKRAVDLLPTHIGYRYQLARVLTQAGSSQEAVAHYEAILTQDSTYAPALVNLGLLLTEQREYSRAADTFGRAVRQNPRNFLSQYYLASSLVNAGRADSARTYLAACLTLNPAYAPAQVLLAALYFKQGDYREALRLYTQASAQNPQGADLFYKAGLCHEKLQRQDRAAEAFRQAALLDSTNSLYFAHLGQSYFQLRRFQDAADAFERAAVLDDDNPMLFQNLGLSWAQTDSVRRAIDAFNRAVDAHHPERVARIYAQMGALYFNKKRFRSARSAYRKALQCEPSNAEAQFYLALTYDQLGDRSSAYEGYRRYLKLASGDSTQQDKIDLAQKTVERLKGKMKPRP